VNRASIWLGIGINPASISTGGGIAMLLPPRQLLWVLPLGALLLTLISISQGLLGRQRRARLAQIAAATFGQSWGAGLLNLLMALGLIGWSGFHGGVSGASLAQLLSVPQWAGAFFMIGALYLFTSFGISRWAALSWITTGAALALTIFALVVIDWRTGATLSTTRVHAAPANLLRSLTTIIGYATLFSLRTPDFTWDFARRRDVLTVNLFYFVPLLFSMGVGALLYYATGNWNIADLLAQRHSAALGHLFLIVAVISPLISGWYSGALAISHMTPLTARQSTLFICVVGFLLAATRFDQQLLPFLGYLGAALGPALTVMILVNALRTRRTAVANTTAWLSGALIAVTLHALGQPLHLLAGAGVSLIIWALWAVGSPSHPAVATPAS
jgi:purine-cytosine permease-like protein